MNAAIRQIAMALPERRLTNAELADPTIGWTAEKIEEKTGIAERRIAADDECASDLAERAATVLFAEGACDRDDIEFLILCTQSPDYVLPTTACLLQDRLGLPTHCGALDFNLGCSGFVYGLGLAKGLIESGQARNVLLLTADTYSKYIDPDDRSVRTLFGDGATATCVGTTDHTESAIGPFVYGTDGRGGEHLIVPGGGARNTSCTTSQPAGNITPSQLKMNGPEIFTFTLRTIPRLVNDLLDRSEHVIDDIDWFVFHQANQYMLEHLREKIGLPAEKFIISMRDRGNTVSSTIPMALVDTQQEGRLKPGDKMMFVGFGVGLSWSATLATWSPVGVTVAHDRKIDISTHESLCT
ncbi:MAG: 3-oxoacyl-ACP synthase III family protein [Aeoliella sp.]